MTPAQRDTLDFIKRYHEQNRVSPTLQEIADALGMCSKSKAFVHVHALITAGELIDTGAKTRGYRPVEVNPLRDVPTRQLRAELARREAGDVR